ncbi:hypothetical protein [Staphylococcus phage PT1-4]
MENNVINLWTDGGFRSSTNISGWAYAGYVGDDTKSPITNKGAAEGYTNQQMEMTAVIKALDSIPFEMLEEYPIKVHTDSAYICNCFKDKWWAKWIMNDWKNSKGKDVANKEYWECIIDFYNSYDIEFVKVKGHSNNEMNNLADKLVNEAMDKLEEELETHEKRS